MSKKKIEALTTETVVFRYTGSGKGGSLPGVPLADLTLGQWEQIPTWLRPSIPANPDYVKAVDVPLEGESHPPKPEPEPETQEPAATNPEPITPNAE